MPILINDEHILSKPQLVWSEGRFGDEVLTEGDVTED